MNLFPVNHKVKQSYMQKSRSITIRTYSSNDSFISLSPSRRQTNKFNCFHIRYFHTSKILYRPLKRQYIHTIMCKSTMVTYGIRFMLSRAVIKGQCALENKLAPKDAEQVGRAALAFIKMITNPEMVENLGQSSKVTQANSVVTNYVYNYITDNTGTGTSTIKTNFLACLASQNKQLVYPYSELAHVITTSNLKFHPAVFESKGAPVRTLVELPIIDHFITRFPQIKEALILGDNITISGRTKNINRDVLVTFTNDSRKDFDVKSKGLDTDVLEGNIREVSVSNKHIITYPRDYTLLEGQYTTILGKLKNLVLLDNIKKTMSIQDRVQFNMECTNLQNKLSTGTNLLENHKEIENALMNINQLPSYVYNMNFYNIYQIKAGLLTEQEMIFLQRAIDMAHPAVLSKPSYMTKYLVDCLHAFNQEVNCNTYNILKPLVKVYPFVKQLLINDAITYV